MEKPKYFLYEIKISQRDMVEFDLIDIDVKSLFIYALVEHMAKSEAVQTVQFEGKTYYRLTAPFIIQQLPLIKTNSRMTVHRYVKELIDYGLIVAHVDNQKKGQSYYTFGKTHYKINDRNYPPKETPNDLKPVTDLLQVCNKNDTRPVTDLLHNNNTLTIDKKNKDKSEEQKKITRTPKAKKEPNQADPNAKPVSYWQNELLNNPEQMAKVRTWCSEAAKEKIGQSLSVFRHTYTEQQLNAYCEHYATILDVPVYKTMFTQTGDIISCDLVHHIINKAKFELENKGKINIPLPQMTAAAIKQRAVDVDPFTKHFQKTSK